MPKNTELKKLIRGWLIDERESQEWLAHEIGIDHSLLSRVLNGYRPLDETMAAKLEERTGLDISRFVTRREVSA